MSCAPVVGWGGAVREGRVLQAEGSSHVLLPELTAGAGARTKGAPRCAGRVAGVRPARQRPTDATPSDAFPAVTGASRGLVGG